MGEKLKRSLSMDFVNEKLEEFNKFLDGKKVAIIGMGVSNVPLLDYFYDKNAKVTVFDKRNLSDEIMEKISGACLLMENVSYRLSGQLVGRNCEQAAIK